MRLQKDGAVICPLYQEEKLSSKNKPFGRYGFPCLSDGFWLYRTSPSPYILYKLSLKNAETQGKNVLTRAGAYTIIGGYEV